MKLGESIEFRPVHIALLTPSAQMSLGHPANFATICHQQRPIIIDTVMLIVSAKFRIQNLPHLANRGRELMMKPKTHLFQLHAKFLARRFPLQFESTRTTAAAV